MHPDIVTCVECEDGSLRNQKEEQHKLNQKKFFLDIICSACFTVQTDPCFSYTWP